jgi:hypothetical protein
MLLFLIQLLDCAGIKVQVHALSSLKLHVDSNIVAVVYVTQMFPVETLG